MRGGGWLFLNKSVSLYLKVAGYVFHILRGVCISYKVEGCFSYDRGQVNSISREGIYQRGVHSIKEGRELYLYQWRGMYSVSREMDVFYIKGEGCIPYQG